MHGKGFGVIRQTDSGNMQRKMYFDEILIEKDLK